MDDGDPVFGERAIDRLGGKHFERRDVDVHLRHGRADRVYHIAVERRDQRIGGNRRNGIRRRDGGGRGSGDQESGDGAVVGRVGGVYHAGVAELGRNSSLGGSPPYNWTYTPLTNANLMTGTSYYIVTRAYDDAGNIQTDYALHSATFTYDTNVPTATIQVPANASYLRGGQVTTLSGTAADVVSTVANLSLYIQRASDGQYWQDAGASGFGSGRRRRRSWCRR